jgi:hypothetical protein
VKTVATCLDVASAGDRAKEVLEAWIQALDRIHDHIQDVTGSGSDWTERMKNIWESFLMGSSTLIACPCDATNTTQASRAHVTATHLRFIYPRAKKTARPGRSTRKTTPSQRAADQSPQSSQISRHLPKPQSLAVRGKVADDSSDSEYPP